MRFTVRRMMVIPAIVAATLAAWLTVDRHRWGPYRAGLEIEMKSSRSPVARFFRPAKLIRNPDGRLIRDTRGPEGPEPVCFLKISNLEGPDREGNYDERRWALGEGGEWLHKWSHLLGHRSTLSNIGPLRLAEVRRMLAALPPAGRPASPDGVVLISFQDQGAWSTRIYDKASPPIQVQWLFQALRISLR
jgi:hypothetical protein